MKTPSIPPLSAGTKYPKPLSQVPNSHTANHFSPFLLSICRSAAGPTLPPDVHRPRAAHDSWKQDPQPPPPRPPRPIPIRPLYVRTYPWEPGLLKEEDHPRATVPHLHCTPAHCERGKRESQLCPEEVQRRRRRRPGRARESPPKKKRDHQTE